MEVGGDLHWAFGAGPVSSSIQRGSHNLLPCDHSRRRMAALLNVQHEQAAIAAIAVMGVTRIIIAHRQETIAQAERVIVMLGGQLHNLQDLLVAQEKIVSNEPGDEGTETA